MSWTLPSGDPHEPVRNLSPGAAGVSLGEAVPLAVLWASPLPSPGYGKNYRSEGAGTPPHPHEATLSRTQS